MAEPLSPDHVSDFLEDDPTLYEEEFEEEPEEELEEEPEGGLVESLSLVFTSLIVVKRLSRNGTSGPRLYKREMGLGLGRICPFVELTLFDPRIDQGLTTALTFFDFLTEA
ncbi:hypothetical protein Tco_0923521 [Tanacetum coccineum]|uniref:Uncharacterized protein n=1 Tax=Tanacetum coccineum TaxID=301880 RepID=A0ABQ5D2G0_9ASTR